MLLPQILLENFKSNNGLCLISGQRDSRLFEVFCDLIKLKIENKKKCLIVSPHQFDIQGSMQFNYILSAKMLLESAESADVIFIIGDEFMELKNASMILTEKGHQVFYSISAQSLPIALRKLMGSLVEDESYRMADALKIAVWQMMAGEVPLHEYLTLNNELKKMLSKKDFEKIENILDEVELNNNLKAVQRLGLNQSLLQAIIRRKVEIKNAFTYSRKPDQFDQILRKVGI